MDQTTRKLIATGAILAPSLHTLTDVMEWLGGGFSQTQLWLNYIAFVPLPAVLLGLYAVQRPRISLLGLVGALLYGFSFVYFTHTTLLALALGTPTYEQLWAHLGVVYTMHGALMIVGGASFGWATARAAVLPPWAAWLFLSGLMLNLVFDFLPVPAAFQIIGTTLRNAGLVGMGWGIVATGARLKP